MTPGSYNETILSAIESELQQQIDLLNELRTGEFHEMLTYHMGWSGEGAGPDACGKRTRPLMVCLMYASVSPSADFHDVLPAAVAVELIHNFSLVHDDIQDQSLLRRGRPTVWKRWGVAQAINAGDVLFILAHQSLFNLRDRFKPDKVFSAGQIIQEACLNLTRGQFLDLSFEKRKDVSVEEYWGMISFKTAALLSASTHIGAILAGLTETRLESCREFGHYLGMAFQVYDDYLGIWGDSALTGKSTESDLVTGKKVLPVLIGLEKKGAFSKRWLKGSVQPEEAPSLAEQLSKEGVKLFTLEMADQFTDRALQALRLSDPQGEAAEGLYALAQGLVKRQS